MRAFTFVIVAILALGLSQELRGGSNKKGSGNETCELAKRAEMFVKNKNENPESENSFYSMIAQACNEGSETNKGVCEVVRKDPGFVMYIPKILQNGETVEKICNDEQPLVVRRHTRICIDIGDLAISYKSNSNDSESFYNWLNDACNNNLANDTVLCDIVLEDPNHVKNIFEDVAKTGETVEGTCNKYNIRNCKNVMNEAESLFDLGDPDDVIYSSLEEFCQKNVLSQHKYCNEFVNDFFGFAISQFEKDKTTDEICQQLLGGMINGGNRKGAKHCQRVARIMEHGHGQENTNKLDNIAKEFASALLNDVMAGLKEGKTSNQICKDY